MTPERLGRIKDLFDGAVYLPALELDEIAAPVWLAVRHADIVHNGSFTPDGKMGMTASLGRTAKVVRTPKGWRRTRDAFSSGRDPKRDGAG
jgi:hypothetical protein